MILSEAIQSRLRPHQIQPTQRLLETLSRHRTAADLSDTGTGKTYVACAVAAATQLPTLAVVPKIAITQWHRAAEHFDDNIAVINDEMLRTGRAPYGYWDNNPPPGFCGEEYFKCEWCQLRVDPEKP